MRRSLAILMAAATAISTTASFIPAQAAPVSPTVLAAAGTATGSVLQIRDRRDWGDHRRGDDNWRHRRHHHRHDRDGFGFPFYFGFPFAPQAYYQRPYQPYYGYGDCFRTWDGRLICR